MSFPFSPTPLKTGRLSLTLQHYPPGLTNKPKLFRLLVFWWGYSLGGRIALHALLQNPHPWSAAVIVSAHPGLLSKEDRNQRIQTDERWADRFENDNWEQTLSDWNSQTVFQKGIRQKSIGEPVREVSAYSRKALADSLRFCSLGVQEDLRNRLKTLSTPLLWVAGENDLKFVALSEEIAALRNPHITVQTIPRSGHRVLFDQPGTLGQRIQEFIKYAVKLTDFRPEI